MPIPSVEPHPDFFDRIVIGGVSYSLRDALVTAERIAEAVFAQQRRAHDARYLREMVFSALSAMPATRPESVHEVSEAPEESRSRKATGHE